MASIDGGNIVPQSGNDYSGALSSLINTLQSRHSDSGQAESTLNNQLGSIADQFNTAFSNLVGRAPTQDETNQFLKQSGASTLTTATGGLHGDIDPTQLTNLLNSYVGQNFQQQANQTAVDKLTAQQGQANSLADLFRSQGNSAIDETQKSLLDYQNNLFQRLQPNLLTSLKSQGLLDTGGLNEAEAGVQGDLANNASNYIAQLRLNNEQGANQIAFGGASAPYYYSQGQITNQPNVLANEAGGAANFNNNTFMSNLAYQQQLGLIGAQVNAGQSLQPSFMRTLGQSFATGLGNAFGQGSASGINSNLFGSKSGSPGGGTITQNPYAYGGPAS